MRPYSPSSLPISPPQDRSGRSPLHHALSITAISEASRAIVAALLHVTDVHAAALCDKHGRTALHIAFAHQNIRAVSALLSLGASTAALDHDGLTPIFHLVATPAARACLALFLDTCQPPSLPVSLAGVR